MGCHHFLVAAGMLGLGQMLQVESARAPRESLAPGVRVFCVYSSGGFGHRDVLDALMECSMHFIAWVTANLPERVISCTFFRF